MPDESVDLTLNAIDDASDVVDRVADAIDNLPDEATIDVEADTRDALSRIERFDREVDDLTDDARELRIEFRAQTIQREIATALRALERLDDPVDIDVATADLERAQKDLRDLAELADRKYEVDVDADPKRSAQRAAGDLDAMRSRGEGLQSALPAIRGFGDELGGTSAAAGIASQAVADLGDFALITGERFAGAGSKASALATKIGTGLGALGLAGAIGGIAVQLGQTLLPKLQDWIGTSDDAAKSQDELAEATRGAAEAIAQGKYREAVEDFLNANQDVIDQGAEFGANAQDISRYVFGLTEDWRLLADRGTVADDEFRAFVDTLDATRLALKGNTSDLVDNSVAAGFVANEISNATRSSLDWIPVAGKAADAAVDQAESTDEVGDASSTAEQAVADLTAAAAELADEMQTAAAANRDVADAGLDVVQANDAWNETLFTNTLALGEVAAGSAEYNDLLADTTTAAADAADAVVAEADAIAAANGETLSASDSTSLWNQSMVAAARQASGPLKQSIIDYIATVNGIPPEKVSEILADPNYKTIAAASGALDDASATRQSQIRAEAITGSAESELNNTARTRYSTIYGDVVIRRNVRWDQGSGQFVPTGRAASFASPLDDAAPGVAARGAAPSSARMYDALGDDGAALRIAAPSTTTNNVTINLPAAASARDVVRSVDRWARVNGRKP